MARKKYPPIVCRSYIRVGGELVCTDDLTPAQKDYVGAVLKTKYLDALFAGRAEFEPVDLPSASAVFREAAAEQRE